MVLNILFPSAHERDIAFTDLTASKAANLSF